MSASSGAVCFETKARLLVGQSHTMIDASVIICTHNPRPHHLRRVMDALRNQMAPYSQWELLLVDNASEPALAPSWDISWHPNARHIREHELGLAAARRRGISEASAGLLIFVDDDSVLDATYLSEALRIGREWPVLGTWGSGTIVPEFEQQPAEHLKPQMSFLGLLRNEKAYWSNVPSCLRAIPLGAGMCVRAPAAAQYLRYVAQDTLPILGRKGTSLTSHEDTEISLVACSSGWGMGVFPELRITHLIPRARVSEQYLLKLVEGSELSGALLTYKWFEKSVPNPFAIRRLLSVVKNVVLTGGFHRRQFLATVRGKMAARRILLQHIEDTKGTKMSSSL